METSFGSALKDWRNKRRLSQLDLGLAANVSARHVSFLETGRSRPSRSMVLQLCEELKVPRQGRNAMLGAAGFAPAYHGRNMNEQDMAPAREAIDWVLERHEPYPAVAMDRHWCIVKMNRMASLLMAGMGVEEGGSILEAFAGNTRLQAAIENFDEVIEHTIARLRTESAYFGGDPVLDMAAQRLAGLLGTKRRPAEGVLPAFIPTKYRTGDSQFSFFSTFAQFGTAEDIALSELKIEMMFPADETTRELLHALK